MAEGMNNLLGGLMTGFVGSKNKAREMAVAEEYKKAMTDHVKLQAKIDENKIKLETMKFNEFVPLIQQARGMGGGAPQQAQPAMVPSMAQTPQPLENTIAAAQMPLGGGGINIPGDPANNISVRQNNMGNLKYAGQPGATPGTRGFASFPTPEAGFAALQNQIDIDKGRGLTLSQFANKYAPPFENDTNNWIKVVVNYTGASPDTPLASIPTPLLAQGVAKIESGATFGGGGLGTPQQAMAPAQPPPIMTSATNPQQFQPIRTIDQQDALAAAWKWMTGSELRDKKFDYRVAKNGDILVLQEGQLKNRLPGGENSEWKEMPTGGYALFDKTTKRVLAAVPLPKPYQVAGKTTEGDVTHGFIYPTGTPGAGAGGQGGMSGAVVTEPAPSKLPGTVPESIRTKYGENDALINQLDILKSTYKPEYLGVKGVYGATKDKLSGVPGLEDLGDPARKTFTMIYDEMLGQKLHQRGGSALTQQEIMYIKNTLPQLGYSPKLFGAAIEGAKLLLQVSNYEMMASHLTPDKQKYLKAAESLREQYLTQFKPIMEKALQSGPPPAKVNNPLPQGAGGGLSSAGQKYLQERGF